MNKLLLPLCLLVLLAASCKETRSARIGVTGGTLNPCPDSPNCVSTQSTDESRHLDPIPYTGSQEEAQVRLLDILKALDRTTVVTVDGDYVHVEFRSALFGFVDDVEFLFNDRRKVIEFRSASRTGYYDFGVNRKRMEKIRALFRKEK